MSKDPLPRVGQTPRPRRRQLALMLAGSLAGTAPAQAAVFCGDTLEGGKTTAATRPESEAAAISWWASRAGSLGRGYENWEIAQDRKVTCHDLQGGKVQCQASARPCLPEGVTPENLPKLDL